MHYPIRHYIFYGDFLDGSIMEVYQIVTVYKNLQLAGTVTCYSFTSNRSFIPFFFFFYWLFVWLIQCFLIKKVKNLLAYKKYSQDFFSTMIFEVLQNKIYNGIERKKYKLIQYRRYENKKKVYVIFGCYCKLLYPNGIKGYKRLPLNLFDSNHSDLLIVIFNKNWITKKQCFDKHVFKK